MSSESNAPIKKLPMTEPVIEMLSIDITNQCHKECPFCYNSSRADRDGHWSGEEVVSFAADCIKNGIKAVSLGGGEPLEHPEIFAIIRALFPLSYLTVTTNGQPLDDEAIRSQLAVCHPDKIHISIHNPGNPNEVEETISRLGWLESIGVKPGVNLLVSDKNVDMAQKTYRRLLEHLSPSQIIILSMRFGHTPSPADLLKVAYGRPFQSASCLTGCRRPANFASVSWDKKAGWCSFSPSKKPLPELTYQGLLDALDSVEFTSCQQPITASSCNAQKPTEYAVHQQGSNS